MVKAVAITPLNRLHEMISESVDCRLTDTDTGFSTEEKHISQDRRILQLYTLVHAPLPLFL